LGVRLQAWLDAGAPVLTAGVATTPATLHITHSWGGGVARWVGDFVRADTYGKHLQLRAESPQSGLGAGQRLALYTGDRLECPLATWWLQPPIQSVEASNETYRKVLEHIIARYGVGEVIVSSLVGHSLDALGTGLPTVQVLHDHFPLWPLLSVHPHRYRKEKGQTDLAGALSDPALPREFRDHDADGWNALADAYLAAVEHSGVRLVAPSKAARDLFRELAPQAPGIGIKVIPHGVKPRGSQGAIPARPRPDGRLRLVIPGRIQPGKGQQLLLEALPALRPFAQVYLLGTGKSGEAFFGCAGVNVITQYRAEALGEILGRIGPDVAALLSVVPETFSYTLSEMRQFGVPVIATKVGSFTERVEHELDGWLIDPDAEALVALVETLHGERKRIDRVRKHAHKDPSSTLADMVAAYRKLVTAAPASEWAAGSPGLEDSQAGSSAWLGMLDHAGRERLRQDIAKLEKELGRRTEWALERERALEEEQRNNRQWVAQLQAELSIQRQTAQEALVELEDTRRHLHETELQFDRARQDLEQLQDTLDLVLASSSWRLTRPLRALRRAAHNFRVNRAWNPVRWPVLISGLARNLSTVGLKGTLMRMQYTGPRGTAESVQIDRLEAVGDPDPPRSLPVSNRPLVSIVIPAYNNWVYTAACLRSIAEVRNTVRFEVIVVDDCSTDETWERLQKTDGVRALRNEQNVGFIDSCNRGGEAARGEFLVLLNNDTQVTEGWLEHLLDAFSACPDAGLVGARLLYPNGRLQECGGIIFNDGSGWNYGRDEAPDRPEYKYLREADYCSGACFMIETALFRELGGLDTRYRPAYYEDTDLCFRVREAGREVLVQPFSTVIHHEGVTSGTDTGSGTKRYQVVNQEKFTTRWAEVLKNHPARIDDPSNPAPIRAARDHALRGRVLFIDATTPEPDQDSGSLRLTNLMRCFRDLGYGVTFMAENHAHAGRYTRALQNLGVEVVHEPWVGSNHAFFRQRGKEFALVIISRHYVASHFMSMARQHCPNAALVFDTVDLHYLREQRLAELENSLPLRRVAEQTRRSELAVIEASDAVLVVSEAEVGVLAEDAPGALVHVLSNIHEVPGRSKAFKERKDLFFVGGYQHPPNVDAAQWFVNRIWPLIRAQLPDVQFHLIGSKAPDSVRELKGDGVVFHGFVEDLEHYLDGCRLAVAPLRYGAGVKGKVNMSMSHGQPVVATPMAVEGVGTEHGVDVLVAETEQEFAEQVLRLYRDEELWNRISDAAVANVKRHFSLDAARLNVESLLERLQRVQD